ncbi:HAD hydrolase-like protein [Chitinophaga pendula]|uniref:HAD family hydrolase n=1 Tax=Chitinophaga TaxID=79328 RepID=UPI000BAF2B5F|nr:MULTISPECIES: HAD hydrolase-like protein [Chitinophaga]ASZ10112.1 hypothetical protein CK934_03515 [Chitinophaga sp. MD30]UCJ06934.1 HAD hydrolase-like protein [Chitinophaga pendula]
MNVLFDLDGTIIDSSEGIQNAFDFAYQSVYNRTNDQSIRALVGPPMRNIFVQVSGEQDEDVIHRFVQAYQQRYDGLEYATCRLYEGMHEVITTLHKAGKKLFISTNKRAVPTQLILRHLDIAHYFTNIYCIDSVQPAYTSKDSMVANIIDRESLDNKYTLLIGDTIHDQSAAEKNNITFVFASYGFGAVTSMTHRINKPLDIIELINN